MDEAGGRDRGTAADAAATRWVVARPVAQFTIVGRAVVVIVGLATLTASRRVGQREAITDARTTTLVRAQGLVEPAVTDSLADRDPAAVAAVGEIINSRARSTSSATTSSTPCTMD